MKSVDVRATYIAFMNSDLLLLFKFVNCSAMFSVRRTKRLPLLLLGRYLLSTASALTELVGSLLAAVSVVATDGFCIVRACVKISLLLVHTHHKLRLLKFVDQVCMMLHQQLVMIERQYDRRSFVFDVVRATRTSAR